MTEFRGNNATREEGRFHVLIVGWGQKLIDRICFPVEKATGYRFSFIVDPALGKVDLPLPQYHCLFDSDPMELPEPDADALVLIEMPGVPTIHNMIMGDRLVRKLEYRQAAAYASFLSKRMEQLFLTINPSVIVGGYDGLHSGIALAVARKMRIPWFALSFTTIPPGLMGFRIGMTPDTSIRINPLPTATLHELADKTLSDFEGRKMVVFAYLSANSVSMIIKRLPRHLKALSAVLLRAIPGRTNRFTQYSLPFVIKEYVRKRINLLSLPLKSMLKNPPAQRYCFIGLHMQPESSIDVWAPFFSDQFSVIESIARSIPPDHKLLVKLHKSDADNYSPKQLEQLRRLPGVELVSPYADSRTFIENASLIFAIQGNIALEAAMLGRPVLVFGETLFTGFPSASRIGRPTELPQQIREKLKEKPPARDAILQGLISYLSYFSPGCFNDWESEPSQADIKAMADQFEALREYVEGRKECVA